MMKLHRFIGKYLLYSIPAVGALFVWSLFQKQQDIINTGSRSLMIVWEILSWNLMLWFAMVMYILFVLLVSPAFRTAFLSKLGRIKERDEREEHITGKAAVKTFYSTLAVLLVFLFFSIVTITVTKVSPERAFNGKQHNLTIGMSFSFYETDRETTADTGVTIIASSRLPLSKEMVIVMLLLWHLGSFYISSRKVMNL